MSIVPSSYGEEEALLIGKKKKLTLKVMSKFILLIFFTVAVALTVTESASSVNYILIVSAIVPDLQFPSICYPTLIYTHLPYIDRPTNSYKLL